MSDHQLTLGSFDLIRGEGNGWKVETIAEGMDFGSAAPVDVVTRTLLQDGSIVSTDRWENREMTFGVLITGADLGSLAAGEVLLYAELAKRNQLVWTPPDGWGPATVFDVLTSWADFEFNDWGEMEPGTIGRRFVVRLTCAPFARSLGEETIEAVAAGEPLPVEETFTVDDCSTDTGWSAAFETGSGPGYSNFGPDATAEDQVVAGTNWNDMGSVIRYPTLDGFLSLRRSGLTSDMTDTPYLVVDTFVSVAAGTGWISEVKVNDVPVPVMARIGSKLYFDCRHIATLTSVDITAYVRWSTRSGALGWALWVQDITRTNVPPFIGTGRQQFRSLAVRGAARTEVSLRIMHDTSALGEVLVYTNAADEQRGYQPACREFRVPGGVEPTPDSSTASGAYSTVNVGSPEVYDVPAQTLPPGTFLIMGRFRRAVTGPLLIGASARTRIGGADSDQVTTGDIISMTAGEWQIAALGRLTLPPTAVPPVTDAVVRISVEPTAEVQIDDLWLFHTTLGALTWVNCGTGTPAPGGPFNRLWLDTATLDWPRPAIWMGTEADGSDRRHADSSEVRAFGTHTFPPTEVNVFTVTSNAENAAASGRYTPAWPNNAA